MASVYDYLDYRDYLRDYYENRKKVSPWYSYKLFGDGVGLDQSQVYRILQKQLHISAAARGRFASYLELSGPAQAYFFTLIDFSRARKEAEHRRLFALLLEMRGSSSSLLEENQFGLYQTWYMPVVRALIGVLDITDDYARIASCLNPPISAEEARKAVKELARLKLVARDRDGVWRLQGKSWSTGSSYSSVQIRRYQAHTFQLIEQSLDRIPKELRDINVVNMGADGAAFADCVAILAEARRQIRDRIERVENPDRILRLATGFIPVAGPMPPKEQP